MTQNRFIDHYNTILFDVCDTLMFGYDRYGPGVDYYPEYARVGGNTLSPEALAQIINQMQQDIVAVQSVEANCDPFPSMRDVLHGVEAAQGLTSKERAAIETVFARHECGLIPDWVAAVLYQIHQTHPIGIVSNVWSDPAPFEAELERLRLQDLFHPRIWSANYGCWKPAPRLFRTALAQVPYPPEQVLFVGDTFLGDIVGAKRLGMAAAWVNAAGAPLPEEYGVIPDLIIRSIDELLNI